MPNHNITKDTAIELIKDFLNDPTLGPIGRNKAIGGVMELPTDGFTLATGWAFWFCWNPEEPDFPPFFLAAETNTYDNNPDHTRITNAILKRSHDDHIFQYNNSLPATTAQVTTFLENPPRWDDKKDDMGITNFDVGEFTANFSSHFPSANTRNIFNRYTYGFFTGGEVDELINQGRYVRYYFGYQSESGINKIKIILVSNDAEGNNLLDDQYVKLELSWPPS